ncbi:hypothetical protein I3760_13G071600 [Carya illinoinensis]|nr:hypothetical protein I3760_13G071600 [Carya illinoinensis]
MKSSTSKGIVNDGSNREMGWEIRPGGMLVQKRDSGDASSGATIKIKVSHDSYYHDVTVPTRSTFVNFELDALLLFCGSLKGDLKIVLSHEIGMEPKEQRLLFRGKEKEDEECLDMTGVKDMSKVVLLEDPTKKERKLEEMQRNQFVLTACEAVAKERTEVDGLSAKIIALKATVRRGTKTMDKEFVVLTELLMVQLLKLGSIEADGEAKVQRRFEVCDYCCFAYFYFS